MTDASRQTQCSLELEESHEDTGKFRITGILNFDSIIILDQKARDLFGKYNKIIIDLAGVTYVNSAGLALLLEWKRQTMLDKKSIRLLGIPQKLQNIAHITEIENILSE